MDSKRTILIVGDGGVGKTNFIKNLLNDTFERRYIPTDLITEYETDNVKLWDYPGQIKFNVILPSNIDLYIIMYDVTNKLSYKSINFWKQKIIETGGTNAKYIIVGNKIDLVNERKVFNDFTINVTCKNQNFTLENLLPYVS